MKSRKGIILAGGSATRLHPLTSVVCKQLLPVYDKPLIYYPLVTLMLAGIRDLLVITTPHDKDRFSELLGNGSKWGLKLTYVAQPKPDGIAQAFVLGREFLDGAPAALILGDNIFYGSGLGDHLRRATASQGATIFGYRVSDPERYGVAELDAAGAVISIEEKPRVPKSSWAVTGLYFYDADVTDVVTSLKKSSRGEYEITDVNLEYLRRKRLRMELLSRGTAWLDTGTHDSLHDAASFIQTLEKRQGLKVSAPEEVAWRLGFIDGAQLGRLANELSKSAYGNYLSSLLTEDNGT